MRDNMKPCEHTLSDDLVYKEVVVIGNGPSGMVTSFMLAGNIPHLKQIPDHLPIDEMLKIRLQNLPPGQNLLEADLVALAEGLEGRSQNPIALLVDNLLRPCADLGIQEDSLIDWQYHADKQIDHVVLGKGPAGGAWHTFPGGVRTLSPRAWLALPPHAALGRGAGRAPARAVAAYCRRYVHACKLQRYFRSGVTVTSVTRAGRAGAACGPACPRAANFLVSGYDKSNGCGFRYACRRVVVACGGGDRPNALPDHLSRHAVHSLAHVERALQQLAAGGVGATCGGAEGAPVVVVGSGVSAADAVRLARRAALPAAHVHRAANDSLAKLAPAAYPDYCHVYKMMMDGPSGNHPYYTPYPEHMIVDINPVTKKPTNPVEDESLQPKRVKLLNLVTNETVELTTNLVAVLIGSKPDLFFLQTNFSLNDIDVHKECIKCIEKKEENQRLCFLKNHWHYFKSVLEQSIQSCKSRYLNSEINGNSDTKCLVPNCNKRKIFENTDAVKCKCAKEIIPYAIKKVDCECPTNPYSCGIGFGVDPKKPVDGRSNPIAIDKRTHEILNAPKGMYALGPLTADNFIRFIPGGAVAIVAHLHRELKHAE